MSETVGLRDLRQNLAAAMNRVREGETLIVTDHNKPIAELRPIGPPSSERPETRREAYERLVREGVIIPARRPLVLPEPIELDGPGLSEALEETRADRDL